MGQLKNLMKDLEDKLLEMLTLSESIIKKSFKYYFTHQAKYLEEVVKIEEDINKHENMIDEKAINIFALQQPFAYDLRKVVMSMKINTDVERIGDLAYSIAHRANGSIKNDFYSTPKEYTKDNLLIVNQDIIIKMIKMLKEAFKDKSIDKLRSIISMDEEVDHNNSLLFRVSIENSFKYPERINFYLNHSNISKSLERIGDHCTNIAQDLIYVFTGENVRHHDI